MASAQGTIFDAVEQRGYVAGWTPGQFAMRQVLKLVEELAEVARHLRVQRKTDLEPSYHWSSLLTALDVAAEDAERLFKDREWCARQAASIDEPVGFANEVSDCQVVLSCMAELARREFGRTIGTDFNGVHAAVNKATADVARGTSK